MCNQIYIVLNISNRTIKGENYLRLPIYIYNEVNLGRPPTRDDVKKIQK